MSKKMIFSVVMSACLAVVVMEILPTKQQALRMYRSVRSSGRRTKKDILDIYHD